MGTLALLVFVFWRSIAAPTLPSPAGTAFSPHRAGCRALPAPLRSSSGASLLPAAERTDSKIKLMDYKDKRGDCDVQKRQGSLGNRARQRRIGFKSIARLESIGFVWDPLEQEWSERFDELTAYKAEHGDCNVPKRQGSLGNWVQHIRKDFKTGKLSDERIARLESIGFVWDQKQQQWLDRFEELAAYKAKNGDCNVPRAQGSLVTWMDRQRHYYKNGRLSQERLDLLESIGFSWEPIDENWFHRLDELAAYKDEHGDCNVPQRQGSLGTWVSNQRLYHKKGKLSCERIELLEKIGFEWILVEKSRPKSSKYDEQWKTVYTELVHYRIEHGSFNVPQKYGPLGRWVGRQRESYKDRSMTQIRMDYLDSIGFVWTTKRVGNEWLPDQYSEPDPEAIARIVEDEKPRHEDLPPSAKEAMKTRVDVGRRLAEALEEYLGDSSIAGPQVRPGLMRGHAVMDRP